MELLTDLVTNVVVIVLLSAFLELLLPSSNMQRYVKVIMGLFILVSVITPVLTLLAGYHDLAIVNWGQTVPKDSYATVLQDSNRIMAVNQELLRKNYALSLEKQMETVVILIRGVQEARAKVRLQGGDGGNPGGIESVEVWVSARDTPDASNNHSIVEPVRIDLSGGSSRKGQKGSAILNGLTHDRQGVSPFEKKTAEEIRKTISQYFGLELRQIKVYFQESITGGASAK